MQMPWAVLCQRMIFTMKDNAAIKNTLSAAFWLALWQAAAMLIGSRIILPGRSV